MSKRSVPRSRKLSGVFFIVALAAAGYLLIRVLPAFIEDYQKAAAFNPVWGYIYLGIAVFVVSTFVALAVWALWTLVASSIRKRARRSRQSRAVSEMTAAQRTQEIQERLAEVHSIAADEHLPADFRATVGRNVAGLEDKWREHKLEIAAFGTISSGKSSLLNTLAGAEVFRTDVIGGTTLARSEVPWPGFDRVVLVDTPGLAEVRGQDRESLARLAARDADLVLLVVDGPLKDFEFQVLEQLAAMEKPVVVCLNKADWYTAGDRKLLTEQVAEQVRPLVPAENVVMLRAQPAPKTRVRVLADGTEMVEQVAMEPDISPLAERMMKIVRKGGSDLLLANLLLRSRGLASEARSQVQSALDDRARELVDRYMWQTGGAAALSPIPLLDVAAALALTTKMVIELARVYRQDVDLEAAGRLVSEMGKNLVSIMGSTMATPILATALASTLKTVPGIGTIAGGVLQGLVQALVTRWTGNVFIVYFRNEMREPEAGWAAVARANWEQITRPTELARLVRMGMTRLGAGKE